MKKKDIKVSVNKILWQKAKEKIKTDFGRSYLDTDCLLIVMLLSLYKLKKGIRADGNLYLALEHPSDLDSDNYILKTREIYDGILAKIKGEHPTYTYSDMVNSALADYLIVPLDAYTDHIKPLYTIVGYKNTSMQGETASAVDAMTLDHKQLTLIDGCCATGSLFFGLKSYDWKDVVLNDMNPLRTNFLNVIKKEPLKLIKKILDTDLDFINQQDSKNQQLHIFKDNTKTYADKRQKYIKVDCNIDIAYQMFLQQCIDKANIEKADDIIKRLLRFLPAHLKLKNAIITQRDCLTYLVNDYTDKLVLLDVPYIGSEKECAVKTYQYDRFHKKVANLLNNADYPFIYYCRSSAPKSDKSKSNDEKEAIMKMKLGMYFFNKGYYMKKVRLHEDTELMISNQHYSEPQFIWDDYDIDIL